MDQHEDSLAIRDIQMVTPVMKLHLRLGDVLENPTVMDSLASASA